MQYTADGINWQWADSGRIFAGNTNRSDTVINQLFKPFDAYVVRIWPVSWHKHISMKVEVWIDSIKSKAKNPQD